MSLAFLRPKPRPSPLVEPRETADIETSSEAYARRFPGALGEFLLAPQTRALLDLLAPYPGARVLELGGGHAQVAPILVRHGYSVTVAGSDESCRERLDRVLAPDQFEFLAVDLLDLPFPDRSFDVVVSLRLLAHVQRWRQLLGEMCRVSRAAVVFDYSDTRSFNRLYDRFFEWKRSLEGNTRSFHCFAPGELAAECARHGFPRSQERREFFIPMVVHRTLHSLPISRTVEAMSQGAGLTRRFGSPVVLRAERLGQPQG
jgi:SAM-dependent methyltransferase